jgi:hypothetical protein
MSCQFNDHDRIALHCIAYAALQAFFGYSFSALLGLSIERLTPLPFDLTWLWIVEEWSCF